MKKLSRQTIAALALGLCATGPVTAGNVTIPNTFSSGTPAVAAEVNANFDALATAVNDNDSRITANSASITANSASITTNADNITTNSNDLAALQTAVTTLQATVADLQSTVTNLQDDLTAANDTIAGLQADLDSANSTIASLQANSVLDLDGMLVYAVDDYGFPTARFTGVNVQVVNGAGQTTVNGLGNLIVGYNEEYVRPTDFCSDGFYDNQSDCEGSGNYWASSFKSGSHNLVVGGGHSYSRSGGVVFGYRNVINGSYATVSGGGDNFASGWYSSVSGGRNNVAGGAYSSVSGGTSNTASGDYSSVSGGRHNAASGLSSSVSGGLGREAIGTSDWAAGSLSEDF